MNLPDLNALNQKSNDIFAQKVLRENRNAGRYDASELFKHLQQEIADFERSMGAGEEIGLRLANFGASAELHIRSVRHQDPNLIKWSGVDLDGNNTVLVQHISQLNFLLIAMKPIGQKPFRLGFLPHT